MMSTVPYVTGPCGDTSSDFSSASPVSPADGSFSRIQNVFVAIQSRKDYAFDAI